MLLRDRFSCALQGPGIAYIECEDAALTTSLRDACDDADRRIWIAVDQYYVPTESPEGDRGGRANP